MIVEDKDVPDQLAVVREQFMRALGEVLSAYAESRWSIDGRPDVGPELIALGELVGIDVEAQIDLFMEGER